MSCEIAQFPESEIFFTDLLENSRAMRIPLMGGIELTARCNLRCVHCYLQGTNGHTTRAASTPTESYPLTKNREMSTGRILRLLDEIAEAGCLFLLLSGGEPLLRGDFPEIYRHARESGLQVTVYTNGTLISENIIELFKEYPPQLIEVTIYGASASTYEAITGVPGSFRRFIDSMDALVENGIRIGTKTMLMTVNHHELAEMVDMAEKWGCQFKCSGELFPTLSGDSVPLEYRLSPRILVEEEMSNGNTRKIWERISLRHKKKQDELADKLYVCGAGSSGFYITAGGWLLPCMVATNIMDYNLLEADFATGWKQMPALRDRILVEGSPCVSCTLRSTCQPCPERLAMESGKEGIPAAFHCELARCRNLFLENGMQHER